MDPDTAEAHVSRTRQNSIRLMAQREAEIEAGLVHYTPAVARDVARERDDLVPSSYESANQPSRPPT